MWDYEVSCSGASKMGHINVIKMCETSEVTFTSCIDFERNLTPLATFSMLQEQTIVISSWSGSARCALAAQSGHYSMWVMSVGGVWSLRTLKFRSLVIKNHWLYCLEGCCTAFCWCWCHICHARCHFVETGCFHTHFGLCSGQYWCLTNVVTYHAFLLWCNVRPNALPMVYCCDADFLWWIPQNVKNINLSTFLCGSFHICEVWTVIRSTVGDVLNTQLAVCANSPCICALFDV